MDVTPFCNLKCDHCYSGKLRDITEISFIKLKNLIDSFAKMNVFSVDIVGREPFVRKDIIKIIKYIKSKNIIVNIATNATLLTEKIVKELSSIGIGKIQVSIDHSNSKIHNKFRRSNCFDKTLIGINLLTKYNIDVVVCTTLTNFNYDDLENIIKIIIPLKAKYYRVRMLIPDDHSKKYLITKKQYKSVVRNIFDLNKKYKNIIIRQLPHSFLMSKNIPYLKNKDISIPCDSCVSRLSITYDLKATPCIALSDIYFEDINNNFELIWKKGNIIMKWRLIFKNIKGKCSICGYRYFCGGGCRAVVYGVTKDIYESDPFCWFDPYKANGDKYEIK
jgi:radical SAM protein with 4Fe4S-binding SPASM domain